MEVLLSIDKTITDFLYNQAASPTLQKFFYVIASGFIYLIPAVLLVMFFRSHRERLASVKIFLASILAWQGFTGLLGMYLYDNFGFRDRPFADLGLQELLFERPQKAFPSDHSALLMAMIIGLFAYKYPKLGWLFLVGGVLSSLSRVVLGFHWFGDILVGWLLGALALGAIWLFDRPLTKIIESITARLSYKYGRRSY